MRTRLSTCLRACRRRSRASCSCAATAAGSLPAGGGTSGASASASSCVGLRPSTHSVTSTRRVVYRQMVPGTAEGARGRGEVRRGR